jgi:hypothetical protein
MIKKAMFPFTLAVTPFAELDPREVSTIFEKQLIVSLGTTSDQ